MTLKKCWNCNQDKAERLAGDDFISCGACGATGPSPDPEGKLWNMMHSLHYGPDLSLPVATLRDVTRPEPSRLEIAAMMIAGCYADSNYDPRRQSWDGEHKKALERADRLIEESRVRAEMKGGAA